MKRIIFALILSVTVSSFVFAAVEAAPAPGDTSSETAAPAGPQGILPPAPTVSTQDCVALLKIYQHNPTLARKDFAQDFGALQEVLGCAIKTGRVSLWMIPYFVTSLLKFLIGLAGLIAVLFILVGGYKYVMGGLTDDKESGKKTVKFAIIGLVVALLSWIIVNVVQVQITR